MNDKTYDAQTDAMQKIADIASDAGLILGWESHHAGDQFLYFEGDWEEGDIDMESVDRIVMTRTVDDEGTPLFDDTDTEDIDYLLALEKD